MKNIVLKKAREEKSLTQLQIARIAGISELAYQNYESGKRIPRADIAIRIAEALQSTVEALFSGISKSEHTD